MKFAIRIEKQLKRSTCLYGFDFDNFDGKNFIDIIDKSLAKDNRWNYNSNVKGKRTTNIFLEDPNFKSILFTSKNYLSAFTDILNPEHVLCDAYGIRLDHGDWTANHRHGQADVSGILYLSSSNQKLFFPSLKIHIKPEPGRILFWDSLLRHEAKPNLEDNPKHAIVFNLYYASGQYSEYIS